MTVTLLFKSDTAESGDDDDDASAAAAAFDDRSKIGDAGGVLKVIRAAVAIELGAMIPWPALLGVLGEFGDKLISGASTPLRFSVNLSPPFMYAMTLTTTRTGWGWW